MSTATTGTITDTEAGPRALSCYSANIAAYLARRDPGVLDVIARSVRLAVRTGLPGDAIALSHHRTGLHELPADGVLAHAAASSPPDALAGVTEEVDRHGRAVVVATTGALPWSPAGPGDRAPHLLLVDGRDGGRWRVVDEFAAQLPGGRQDPFTGLLDDRELLAVMAPPPAPRQEHRLRDENMFGVPIPLPAGGHRWLVLRAGPAAATRLPPDWLTGADEVLGALAGFWSGLGEHPDRARFVDDMWAAAQHHTFRYARLLRTHRPPAAEAEVFAAAAAAWRDLPMALHFAARSAARGRARPAVVSATFEHLSAAEHAAAAPLARYGYGPR